MTLRRSSSSQSSRQYLFRFGAFCGSSFILWDQWRIYRTFGLFPFDVVDDHAIAKHAVVSWWQEDPRGQWKQPWSEKKWTILSLMRIICLSCSSQSPYPQIHSNCCVVFLLRLRTSAEAKGLGILQTLQVSIPGDSRAFAVGWSWNDPKIIWHKYGICCVIFGVSDVLSWRFIQLSIVKYCYERCYIFRLVSRDRTYCLVC